MIIYFYLILFVSLSVVFVDTKEEEEEKKKVPVYRVAAQLKTQQNLLSISELKQRFSCAQVLEGPGKPFSYLPGSQNKFCFGSPLFCTSGTSYSVSALNIPQKPIKNLILRYKNYINVNVIK